tara:strand:+ start:351 stop:1130 length:780 start_codon:yes stop_codon:yes gene_type:complete
MNAISNLFKNTQLHTLERDMPTPLYYKLYSLLKGAILDGSIDNGSQMPTEQQLAETFNVSRITAKRAMDELAAEELVERRRGKGTHVTYEYSPKPVQAPLIGMLEEIESMARHSDVKVLKCRMQLPPTAIREALGLDSSDKVLQLERVRYREGQPFGYYTSWTNGLKKPVSKKDFQTSPRLAIFRKQGLKITHVTQTISAAAATPALAEALDTDVGAPLLSLVRHSFKTVRGQEQLADYLQVFYHPDRFQYQMDLTLDG